MRLTINGELKVIEAESKQITLDILIKTLNYHPQLIVVEYNGEILNPNLWSKQEVKNGDNLEIVTIVGGGA